MDTKITFSKNLFVLILVLIAHKHQGQELPNIIPPSPDARKMIEYGAVPVSYNVGTLDIEVPLTSINIDNVSFPIKLSYNSNGVKVSEDSGKTGLKWMLSNGSGRITRVVKGRPDEDEAYINSGWLHYGGGNLDFTNLTLEQETLIEYGCFDLEPDEFVISLPNGFSRKFVFDKLGQIITIPQTEEVDISYTFNLNSLSWNIKDALGIEYIFSTQETATISGCSTYYVKSYCTEYGANFPTSWLLDKIILPSGNTINYTYSNDLYVEDKWVSQTYKRTMSQSVGQTETCSNLTTYYNKKLTKIAYKDNSINYYYSNKVINNNELGSKLDRLTLNHKSDKIEEFTFLYELNQYNRMFLMNIRKKSRENTEQLLRRFEYYDKNILPNKNSFSIDHFGFYNSSSSSNDNRIYGKVIPNKDYYIDTKIFSDGINRNIDTSKIKAGTLKRVYYPTGGYTQLKYEPNMAYENKSFKHKRSFSFSRAPTNTPLGWQTYYTAFFSVEDKSTNNNHLEFTSLYVTLFNEKNDPRLNWQRPSFELLNENGNILYSRTLFLKGENINSPLGYEAIENLSPGNYRFRIRVYNSSPNIASPYTYSLRIRGNTFYNEIIGNQYYGGLRIKTLSNYSSEGILAYEKDYSYEKFDENGVSSGLIGGALSTAVSFNVENYDYMNGCYLQNTNTANDFEVIAVSSNPALSNYLLGAPVRYSNVMETFKGDNNYSIKRYFKNFGRVIPPFHSKNKLIRPRSGEDFALGVLVREDIMDFEGNIIKKNKLNMKHFRHHL